MKPVMDPESMIQFSSHRHTKLRPSDESSNYVEHPYRFVAFGIFVTLNMLCGIFMSAFLPLTDLITLVA